MAQDYQPALPQGLTVKPDVVEYFRKFYEISDTPGAHNQYVDMFTPFATFILASSRNSGHDDIMATRQKMWSTVSSRKHTVCKLFPFGRDSNEYMLYGSVVLGLQSGGEALVEWAARAVLDESLSDKRLRMSFYQVYLDTGATAAYKK